MQFVSLCILLSSILGVSAFNEWTRAPFVKDEKCLFRVNPGPCHGKFEVFGYDPFSKTCSKFIYRGCGGNPNRFGSELECRQACNPVSKSDNNNYEETVQVEEEDYLDQLDYDEYNEESTKNSNNDGLENTKEKKNNKEDANSKTDNPETNEKHELDGRYVDITKKEGKEEKNENL